MFQLILTAIAKLQKYPPIAWVAKLSAISIFRVPKNGADYLQTSLEYLLFLVF